MAKTIGVNLSERIAVGLVVDHKLAGPVRRYPENHEEDDALIELHTDALVEKIAALLPAATKWKLFFKTQAKNTKYLSDGDVIEASVATDDGAIDLGTQRTVVRYAR